VYVTCLCDSNGIEHYCLSPRVQVRRALCEAERQLEMRQHMPLADLQQWLQLTYEIETRYFEEKRQLTEKQLCNAKDMVQCCLIADELRILVI